MDGPKTTLVFDRNNQGPTDTRPELVSACDHTGRARRGPLRRGGALARRTPIARTNRLARRTPLRRGATSSASDAQRAKVRGERCLVCDTRPVDPAHLVPRARGGCDDPDCVVALCRRHHRAFDRRELDLLPHLEPGHRRELSHALSHLSLLALLCRATGERWAPSTSTDA